MGMENGLASALRISVPVEQAEVVSDALVLLAALLTVVFRPARSLLVIPGIVTGTRCPIYP